MTLSRSADTSGPRCVPAADPHHVHLVYAHPADVRDRFTEIVSTIREQVGTIDSALSAEAMTEGRRAHYRLDCDEEDRPQVDDVTLPTSAARTTFSSIVGDLTSQGYSREALKYLVWYDGTRDGIGGQATLCHDDSPGEANCSNHVAGYAVNFGRLGDQGSMIDMHELGHTLGAVQNSAPHSTGDGHVNGGEDVMCATVGCRGSLCSDRVWWDCRHVDYWAFDPRPGSYLAGHFDLARDSLYIAH
jgi:hypothetical protein